MKAELQLDGDNWLYVTVSAETAQEAAQLVKLGMNMGRDHKNTDTSRSVNVEDETVKMYISVMPTKSRRRKDRQMSWIRFAK